MSPVGSPGISLNNNSRRKRPCQRQGDVRLYDTSKAMVKQFTAHPCDYSKKKSRLSDNERQRETVARRGIDRAEKRKIRFISRKGSLISPRESQRGVTKVPTAREGPYKVISRERDYKRDSAWEASVPVEKELSIKNWMVAAKSQAILRTERGPQARTAGGPLI